MFFSGVFIFESQFAYLFVQIGSFSASADFFCSFLDNPRHERTGPAKYETASTVHGKTEASPPNKAQVHFISVFAEDADLVPEGRTVPGDLIL